MADYDLAIIGGGLNGVSVARDAAGRGLRVILIEQGDLGGGASVAGGRRREFKRFAAFADDAAIARIPDPNAESSFLSSKLRWQERRAPPHQAWLRSIRELLNLRQRHLAPHLHEPVGAGRFEILDGVLRVEWPLREEKTWRLLAYFGRHAAYASVPPTETIIFSLGMTIAAPPQARLEPGSVIVSCS